MPPITRRSLAAVLASSTSASAQSRPGSLDGPFETEVSLDGTYSLLDEQMNLHGKLRMQATVSKAIGGFRSIFIRPFDFVFRKEGAGAVIPIKISGPRTAPKFGIEAGKIFGK